MCSLALLGAPLPKAPDRDSIIAFIASCQVRPALHCMYGQWTSGRDCQPAPLGRMPCSTLRAVLAEVHTSSRTWRPHTQVQLPVTSAYTLSPSCLRA